MCQGKAREERGKTNGHEYLGSEDQLAFEHNSGKIG